jgi:hypothetical protein
VPKFLAGLVTAAKGGDIQAGRLNLERVLPPMKAIEQAIELRLPDDGTLTTKATAVLSAAAAGELAPTHAAQLITALVFCWLVLVGTRTKPCTAVCKQSVRAQKRKAPLLT